jgi:DNA polymerase III subunit beta
MEILANVLLRADGGGLSLQATDLDMEVSETVVAAVDEPGATTVPAHLLHNIVRELPADSKLLLDITEADDWPNLTLKSGRSWFALQTLPAKYFPALAPGESFQLPGGDLRRLIEKTQFAIPTEETRYYLHRIYFHLAAGALRSVATDGHRLALADRALTDSMPAVIVPRRTVGEVLHLIEEPAAVVAVELSATRVRFTVGRVVLTSKLIDETFPDYAAVIPGSHHHELKVDRREFAAAVSRVSLISTERGRAVRLALSAGKLTLSVVNPDIGRATEELDAHYQGEAFEIGFNSRYLLNIAAQIDGPTMMFRFTNASSPTLISDLDVADLTYVLMPMAVGEQGDKPAKKTKRRKDEADR